MRYTLVLLTLLTSLLFCTLSGCGSEAGHTTPTDGDVDTEADTETPAPDGDGQTYVCVPGRASCFTSHTIGVCDEYGQGYESQQNCTASQTCVNGVCVTDVTPICTPGQYACYGAGARWQCNGDGTDYDKYETCATGAACKDGVCISPTPDGDTDSDSAVTDGDTDATSENSDLPDAPTLVMATFNTHTFFDTICDSGSCGSGDWEDTPDAGTYAARVKETSKAVAGLGADIVMLEEIEKESGLTDINNALATPYPVAIFAESGGSASVDVAILARGTFVKKVSHLRDTLYKPDGSATHFLRDFLEVHLLIGGRPVIAFAAHYKSQRDDDYDQRQAEAGGSAKIIRAVAAANPKALIVMGGDLNDTPGSDTLNTLINDGHLLRAAADCSDCGTYRYNGQSESIDHLLMSLDAGGRYIAHSAQAVHGASTFAYGGSDHAALKASFSFTY